MYAEKIKEIEVTDELAQTFLLEYYVTKREDTYGIKIEEHRIVDGIKTFTKNEETGFILKDEAVMKKFAGFLASHSAMPVTLSDIMEDMSDVWKWHNMLFDV